MMYDVAPSAYNAAIRIHHLEVNGSAALDPMNIQPCVLFSQGRFSFYMTSNGEEATVIASAAALDPNDQVPPWADQDGQCKHSTAHAPEYPAEQQAFLL